MIYSNINKDRSERVAYDKSDFPVYIRKGILSAYPNYSAESHWHDDVEFIFILYGSMQYNINGEVTTLNQGEGIFVNTRQLHFGYSENKEECVFICVLLHPILLCSSRTIEQKYVMPLLFNEHIPFYRFTQKDQWETDLLYSIQEMYNACTSDVFELKVQQEFYKIWIALYEHFTFIKKENTFKHHHLSALKDMISFIGENYQDKLTLENIAKAGKVAKTSCCAIFNKYVNKTPNEFLTDLRLRKAIELLSDTDMTIFEISYNVGFSGASYFTEVFHKYYDCTPKEYKTKNKNQIDKNINSLS